MKTQKEITPKDIGNALLPLVRFGYNEALKDVEEFLSKSSACGDSLIADYSEFKLKQEDRPKEVDIYKLMDLFVNPYQYKTVKVTAKEE